MPVGSCNSEKLPDRSDVQPSPNPKKSIYFPVTLTFSLIFVFVLIIKLFQTVPLLFDLYEVLLYGENDNISPSSGVWQ